MGDFITRPDGLVVEFKKTMTDYGQEITIMAPFGWSWKGDRKVLVIPAPGSMKEARRQAMYSPLSNNGQFSWTCPACGSDQEDEVSPTSGPFLSLTCGRCLGSFMDEQLDVASLKAWVAARSISEIKVYTPLPVTLRDAVFPDATTIEIEHQDGESLVSINVATGGSELNVMLTIENAMTLARAIMKSARLSSR